MGALLSHLHTSYAPANQVKPPPPVLFLYLDWHKIIDRMVLNDQLLHITPLLETFSAERFKMDAREILRQGITKSKQLYQDKSQSWHIQQGINHYLKQTSQTISENTGFSFQDKGILRTFANPNHQALWNACDIEAGVCVGIDSRAFLSYGAFGNVIYTNQLPGAYCPHDYNQALFNLAFYDYLKNEEKDEFRLLLDLHGSLDNKHPVLLLERFAIKQVILGKGIIARYKDEIIRVCQEQNITARILTL